MQCKILHDMKRADHRGIMAAGSVIEHPQAFILVQMGHATADDAECEVAAGRTPDQLATAQQAASEVKIHPDDLAAFRAGEMIGYDEAGEWIPGPNYVEPEEDEEEPEDE